MVEAVAREGGVEVRGLLRHEVCGEHAVNAGASSFRGEALEAFKTISQLEGIIPALESAHAVAHALKLAREMSREQTVVVNLSGRGDKDVNTVADRLGEELRRAAEEVS